MMVEKKIKNNNTGRDLTIEELPEEANRGCLTKSVDRIANLMIGRSISMRELRLIPYIQYVMCNERRIKIEHISSEEREILKRWKKEGHIEGGASGLAVTKAFWDFMCEVLFHAYVGYDNPEIRYTEET